VRLLAAISFERSGRRFGSFCSFFSSGRHLLAQGKIRRLEEKNPDTRKRIPTRRPWLFVPPPIGGPPCISGAPTIFDCARWDARADVPWVAVPSIRRIRALLGVNIGPRRVGANRRSDWSVDDRQRNIRRLASTAPARFHLRPPIPFQGKIDAPVSRGRRPRRRAAPAAGTSVRLPGRSCTRCLGFWTSRLPTEAGCHPAAARVGTRR